MKEVKQQLLNESVAHVLAQGAPSGHWEDISAVEREFKCDYKSPEGLRCAAAIFIKEYDEKMENKRWSGLMADFMDLLDPRAVQEEILVRDLQDAHDGAARQTDEPFIDNYKFRIRKLCREYALEFPEGCSHD